MKTTQIMHRRIFDGVVKQNHKTGWLNANNLLEIYNRKAKQLGKPTKKINAYTVNATSIEFFEEIMNQENITTVYESKKGKNGGTWMHPLVFVDFAMWVSPEFKYYAMQWLTDELLKNRDESGDSYKKMTSSVASYLGSDMAKAGITIPKIAKAIKTNLKVSDWNSTTEENLKKRDEIQKNISILLKAGVEINKACVTAIQEVVAA